MEAVHQADRDTPIIFHFERSRLNKLFMQVIKYPLVLVCAGAGYGKTCAVFDFTRQYNIDAVWVHLTERDNVSVRFWENYTNAVSQINEPFAKAIGKLGFPDTPARLNQYTLLQRHHVKSKRQIIVMDDFHCINDSAIIRFVEHIFLGMPPEKSLFLLSRSNPRIGNMGLASQRRISHVIEDDLRFTENELAQYFRSINISLPSENGYQQETLRNIMQDTEGWAFAINLIARSYRNLPPRPAARSRPGETAPQRKAAAYTGYLRSAMRTNIFSLMETEVWDKISERLQHFLIRISLIDHLSVDLITLLAGDDKDLIDEMEMQNAYVRRDYCINVYLMHPLFLEFLSDKEGALSETEKRQTYAVAGKWCDKNGFKIDAISYYEKIEDYRSIVNIFIPLPSQIPQDIARYAESVFERAPLSAFDTVLYLASMHLRSVMCQGLWEKAMKLAELYEAKFLELPPDDPFRISTLASIYYCWGISRSSMNLSGEYCDFDIYFKKLDECFPEPVDPGNLIKINPAPWICAVGSARKGAPEEFIGALKRSAEYIAHCFNGLKTGEEDLALGELDFYRADVHAAEIHIARALDQAAERQQFEVEHRAQLYTMRIAVYTGDYEKLEHSLEAVKLRLGEADYYNRFTNYDISLSWYSCILNLPEKVPEWIQEIFFPYCYAGFIENFANQIKARYCYMTKNYAPLLSYIQEMRQRESFLFGRLEMLAMEACVHHKMKAPDKACAILKEAYETASPNAIIMPFIEMGKDMRTLATFALKKPDCGIPKSWLETVSRKSSSYSKRQAHVVAHYKQVSGLTDGIGISQREREVLTDLSHGLSRTEIAASCSISINTVKMILKNIYTKLGAESLADAIRIATERRII